MRKTVERLTTTMTMMAAPKGDDATDRGLVFAGFDMRGGCMDAMGALMDAGFQVLDRL